MPVGTKTIYLAGVGALGSHVAQFIRNLDMHLYLIDFDRVDQKNTLSQFFGRPHTGRLKVEAVRQTMKMLWGVTTVDRSAKLAETNVMELLGPAPGGSYEPLVIDCLDNGASRRVLQAHVRRYGIPCIHGALAPDGAFGRVVWDEAFVIDDETSAGAATCEDGQHLPFIAIVSAYLARAVEEWARTGRKWSCSVSPAGAILTAIGKTSVIRI